MQKFLIGRGLTSLIIATSLLFAISFQTQAQQQSRPGNITVENWNKSGGDGIVALGLDGRILNIYHVQGRRFLRQGYRGADDANRNVEASPRDVADLPSRGLGFEWVLESTGDGYYNIHNLTSGLLLTWDGDDNNVSNWGASNSRTDQQKWKFVVSYTQADIAERTAEFGTRATFRIYNKASNKPLTMHTFGKRMDKENVTIWADPGYTAPGFDWIVMPAREVRDEWRVMSGYKVKNKNDWRSDSLASVRRLTIESIKAIKVSSGQDDATKVLFTGIDLALDAGMGIATGGASAAAKTTLKYGGRALTKEALKAGAKAGAKKMAKSSTKKALAKDYVKRVGKHYGKELVADDVPDDTADGFAELGSAALDLMSSEAMFNKIYGQSPDDLYISVNGFSIFPDGGRSHVEIKSQQTLQVNKSFVFDRFDGVAIQLREYDSGSSDDSLGETSWAPHRDRDEGVWYEFGKISAAESGKGYNGQEWRDENIPPAVGRKIAVDGIERYDGVLISKSSEGSLYEITYRIEPFVPSNMVLGKLQGRTLKRSDARWDEIRRSKGAAKKAGTDAATAAADAAKAKADAQAAALEEDRRTAALNKEISDRVAAEDRARAEAIVEKDRLLAAARIPNAKQFYDNCSNRGRYQSEERANDEATAFQFFNMGSKTIHVYWIGFDGKEVNFASQDAPLQTIAPGPNGVEEIGGSGNWYIAVDDSGECVGVGNAAASANEVSFNPDLVIPGVHPRKAGTALAGVIDTQTGEMDNNQYAADQSGLPNESDYASQETYSDTSDAYTDTNQYAEEASQDYVDEYVEETTQDYSNEYTEEYTEEPSNDGSNYSESYGEEENSAYEDSNDYSSEGDSAQYDSGAEGPGCQYLGQIASPEGGEVITGQFENQTNESIDLYVIGPSGTPGNYQGSQDPITSIAANSSEQIRTQTGHIFAGANDNGNCMGVAEVTYDGEVISFMPVQ